MVWALPNRVEEMAQVDDPHISFKRWRTVTEKYALPNSRAGHYRVKDGAFINEAPSELKKTHTFFPPVLCYQTPTWKLLHGTFLPHFPSCAYLRVGYLLNLLHSFLFTHNFFSVLLFCLIADPYRFFSLQICILVPKLIYTNTIFFLPSVHCLNCISTPSSCRASFFEI